MYLCTRTCKLSVNLVEIADRHFAFIKKVQNYVMGLKFYWIMPYSVHRRIYAVNLNAQNTSKHYLDSRCSLGQGSRIVMFVEVFSDVLDPQKHWYDLNTCLSGIAPRKFCQNELFKLFKEEVKYTDRRQLKNQNGNPISKPWGNNNNMVYVGSTFAVVAGNIRQRDPSASNLLHSSRFQAIKDIINSHSLNEEGHKLISTPDARTIDSSSKSSSNLSSSGCCSLSSSEFDSFSDLVDEKRGKRKRDKLAPKNLAPIFTSTPLPQAKESSTFEEVEKSECGTPYKKRKIREKAESLISKIHDICESNREKLSNVIARCCLFERRDKFESNKMVQDIFLEVEKHLGLENCFERLIPDELWVKKLKQMTVPDWQLLLLKLEAPISDNSWQNLLNRTHLGKGGKDENCAPLLLSKNSIKAIKHMAFDKVEQLFNIKPLSSGTDDPDLPGYEVGLEPVICWQVRDLHLHGHSQNRIQLNLKLDGRPFAGRSQVLVGVAPSVTVNWSGHSCKSFFPLAIANCNEDRKNLCNLISQLNKEKNQVKKNGICVDGKVYTVEFKVTLDLKALYILLVKDDDPDFKLGGKGYAVEFCFFCKALRNCSCDLGPDAICLQHLQEVKANIGGFQGLRDDLIFLLEEDLSSINLCALHCELRNTEQLIGTLGLQAYRIGSLKSCNDVLAKFGPETTGDRIRVKKKEGQQTRVDKKNMEVTSFSGNTERRILNNIEEIVRESLPHEALKKHNSDQNCAKATLLNKISLCSQQVKYFQGLLGKETFTRDFGNHKTEIPLIGSDVSKKIIEYRDVWTKWQNEIKAKLSTFSSLFKKKRKNAGIAANNEPLSDYAAEITFKFFVMVFTEWRDIAETLRNRIYSDTEQHLIDLFDIKCKQWGFLLRGNFGVLLGTGDYGHMTIEHSSMLLRQFGSLREYSNQSIESAHSLQRQLYSKATSHDRHGHASSIKHLLVHFYSERILFFRLCIRKALECHNNGNPFHFVGCGWSISYAKTISWSKEDVSWILEMDRLLTKVFGPDFLTYSCDPTTKVVNIASESLPDFEYDHCKWESEYSLKSCSSSPFTDTTKQTSATQSFATVKSAKVKKPGKQPMKQPTIPSPSLPKPIQYPDLKKLSQPSLTRRQMASLTLPPVKMLSRADVSIAISPLFLTNPYTLSVHPSSTIINLCSQMLHNARKGSKAVINLNDFESDEIAVSIDGLGVFDDHALRIWNASLQAQTSKAEVQREIRWLEESKNTMSSIQCNEIAKVLLDSKPDKEVLRARDIIVDVHDISTLVDERYLTGFLIDVSCFKYQQQAKYGENTIYLPTTCQSWAMSNDPNYVMDKLVQYCDIEDLQRAHWILTPVNVNGAHWGLLCLDLKLLTLFYDDGLHIPPPHNIIQMVEVLLESLLRLSGIQHQFDLCLWNPSLPIERFGMPTQPPGSGSCGMGVILSVNTYLNSPHSSAPPTFDWDFSGMNAHRIMLLNHFIEWKKH